MQERRYSPRHRVLKAASIEFGAGAAIDCTVRNLSSTGAALDVASPVGIPSTFDLLIPADHGRHHCRIAWRKERRIGVVFEA